MNAFDEYMRGLETLELVSENYGRLVRKMGVPVEATDGIDTAAVSFNGKKILFEICSEYFATLSDTEAAAVLSHETLHVLLSHLNERMSGEYEVDEYLVEAHECIINDQIPINLGLDLPGGLYSGPKNFDTDFSSLTSREGYEVVENFYKDQDNLEDGSSTDQEDNNSDDSGSSEGGENTSGDSQDENQGHGSCGGFKINPEDVESFKNILNSLVDDYFSTMDYQEIVQDFGNDVADAVDDIAQSHGYSIGDPTGASVSQFFADHSLVMNWAALLREIDPTILDFDKRIAKRSWVRPNRRITTLDKHIILPTTVHDSSDRGLKNKDKPTIVLALDFSSSIPDWILGDLISLAEALPSDKVNPVVLTWSDDIVVYDDDKRTCPRYGTSVNRLVQWTKNYEIQNKTKVYTVCVTDGGFYLSEDYPEERWHFVNVNKGKFYSGNKFKNSYNLYDFLG